MKDSVRKDKTVSEGKSIKIIIGLLLFFFIAYLACKVFIVYFEYKVITDPVVDFHGTIILEKTTSCDYTFGKFSVCVPSSFSLIDAGDGVIGYTDSQNRFILGGEVQENFDDDILSIDDKVDVSDFKKKYQFSSTVDVLHYLQEHQNKKFNLFSKTSDVRDYYIIWNLVHMLLPEGDLYYIEGDYHGYLIKQKTNYYFYFYDDNGDKYHISFGNSGLEDDYFNDDNVFSFLGSVRMED